MDEIFMTPSAELGPLDVQVEHPLREGEMLSALDIAEALEFLGKTATDLALRCGGAVIRYTGLPRINVMTATLDFAAKMLQPTIDKLDPHLIHRSSNALRIAELYAKELLVDRNVPDPLKFTEKTAETIAGKLIKDYPEHSVVIGPKEAQRLQLPVADARAHPRWCKIKQMYAAFLKKKAPEIHVISDGVLDEKECTA